LIRVVSVVHCHHEVEFERVPYGTDTEKAHDAKLLTAGLKNSDELKRTSAAWSDDDRREYRADAEVTECRALNASCAILNCLVGSQWRDLLT